ncbi:MAG TPA: efflux RND transporter permease subunit [Candidatus Acidoferrales bacterium]|nr:efflux RND transporter permease subunit [Candidatus Acidoferrales bacterium]
MAVTSYLKQLKFDPKLNNLLIAGYLRNPRLVILLILLALIFGIFSFVNLPRVLNPNINIAIVTISTSLPGAGPDDVESLLTIPVEQSVSNVANIDTLTSTSTNSQSSVTIQFLSGVDPDKATSDVQTAVQSVSNLPKDATTPHVQKLDFQNTPVWIFTVTGQDPASLIRFGRGLRDDLKDVATINTVSTDGLDNQEIQVTIKPEAITTYGINPQTLSQTITSAINSQPAGTINSSQSSFALTIDPTITTMQDLRDLQIGLNNGTSAKLSDIADVAIRQQPGVPDSYVADLHHKATQAVTFSIFKKSTANITTADQDAHDAVAKYTAKYPGQFTISSVIDSGAMIDRQFNDLVRDLIVTFCLVFLVILIFLGTRQALVAASAIPMTFLITFIVMHSTGVDLSFIAFFSLLLSLGLLVDDTIVIISALSAYYRTGKFTPMEAGLLVWRDFKTAVSTTTLTTVWAFVPLLLASGIIGEFIKAIPIVVSTSLLASFGVAMFITLPIVIIILRPRFPYRVVFLIRSLVLLIVISIFFAVAPKGIYLIPAILLFIINIFIYFQVRTVLFSKTKAIITKSLQKSNIINNKNKKQTNGMQIKQYFDRGIINFDRISDKYRYVITAILSSKTNRRKTLAMVVIFSLFSYLLLPLGFVRNEFFPASAQQSFQIQLELPAGTNIEQTQKEALNILNDVRKYPEVQLAQLSLGSGAETGFGPSGGGSNLATITVSLPDPGDQKISSLDVAQMIRDKYANYQKGKFSVIEESGGPPAGADVQIKLFGSDLTLLDGYANKLEDYLKKQPGITNVDKSIKTGTSKVVFVPDQQKLIDAGVTEDQVAQWLRTYANGFTLDSKVKIEQGNTQDQDILLRTDANPQTIAGLGSIMIPMQSGSVPLLSLGNVTIKPNPTLITRESQKRTISVSASVTKGYSGTMINAGLEKYADSLNLPDGYSWSTGGVNQQNAQSVQSILEAMLLSFMLIIITMVLQFHSFRKALIVMLVIPLSVSGVFIVFSVTQTPLSFPALIGILALFGIVVKNSILIVDKINQNLRAGLAFQTAIVDAAESRLEPIALTTFAAILGLIPITLSNALWQGLGGAIISGLIFSGSIMLFLIPVAYYLIFQASEGKKVASN